MSLKNEKKYQRRSFRAELRSLGKSAQLKIHEYTTYFVNPQGKQCTFIQKFHKCTCNHRYDMHGCLEQNTIFCKFVGCNCKNFHYLPTITQKCVCNHHKNNQNQNCDSCQHEKKFKNIYCKCGYRLIQHQTQTNLKQNKENINNKIILPKINRRLFYPKEYDDIIQLELPQKDNFDQEDLAKQDNYKRQKLFEINKRYFSKFQIQKQSKIQEIKKQLTALDLFILPHFYKNVSLTKFIQRNSVLI